MSSPTVQDVQPARGFERLSFSEFQDLASAAGCGVERKWDCWLVHGPLVTKYWPSRGVIRVKGTVADRPARGGFDAIAASVTRPPRASAAKREERGDTTATRAAREDLWEQGTRHCRWCGIAFVNPNCATLEHVVPLSRGGCWKGSNATLACELCNRQRGNEMPELFGWDPLSRREEVA